MWCRRLGSPTPGCGRWSARNFTSCGRRLQTNGQTADDGTATFGIRSIHFDVNNGFFLNGERVEINGTCNHQDFAGVGIGLPDNVFYWRVMKLKQMGANAWRCSHNPPAPALLDACDRLGMLVMDENRHLGDVTGAYSSATAPARLTPTCIRSTA